MGQPQRNDDDQELQETPPARKHPGGFPRPKYPLGISDRLKRVRRLQRTMEARIEGGNVTSAELATLTRAWDVLENRRRILCGHGTPAPVPATNAPVNAAKVVHATDDAPGPTLVP